jgi:alginate O-acetyltransferase complex protein AlgI
LPDIDRPGDLYRGYLADLDLSGILVSIAQILILAGVAIGLGRLKRGRSAALLGMSSLVIYWLQPDQKPVNLMYWFPTLTLGIAAICWILTSAPEARGWRENRVAAGILVGVALFAGLNRYLQLDQFFVVETPRLQWVGSAIVIVVAVIVMLARIKTPQRALLLLALAGLVALLVVLKSPTVWMRIFDALAGIRGKDAGGVTGLSWLGFSYVAFRLMHTILDRRSGRLPSLPLADYVNYAIFYPAVTAGPIDRIERFVANLREPLELDRSGWLEAGSRLFSGLFKKFVLADGLAWIAINNVYATYLQSAGPSWILLYAYSLRIFFDFSGYTDIAIGLGRFLGVRLPENFDSPYLKPNITQFWNAWHMTLTQWFRSYFFNPLTRAMRSSQRPLPEFVMIFISQLSTMVLIGLWHGITAGFLLWGIWHGLGLFIHNRWSSWIRPRLPDWGSSPLGGYVLNFSGIFLTFHFVSLGWLFFNLQEPALAWRTLLFLLGVG